MSPRKEPHPVRLAKPTLILALITLSCIVIAAYALRGPAERFLAREHRADLTLLNHTIDSAYAAIRPRKVSTTSVNLSGHDLRCDNLELSKDNSILRANLEISRAVEKAGGRVAYGLESIDEQRRWQTVTLGISDGDSLVREIRLKRRVR